jgi:predicted DCC family thiol-disulfide oxidoreductase YuxK
LIPWGAELFSNQGVLPRGTASPLLHLFPNVFALSDSPGMVTVLLAIGVLLCVLFGIGLHDRAAALGLWYIWACLFGRDPLIANPSIPFVGWLLIAHAFVPPAPYGSWAARGRVDPGGGWRMPPAIFAAAWIVLALSYTYSGYTKLVSPSWRDGTALARVLDNPLARPGWLRETLLSLPAWLLHAGTWTALALELAFAPLVLVRRLRPWLWTMMLFMHLSLIALLDFADLSLGMVMIHLFTWDPGWVRPLSAATEKLFYDGHCGLCQRSVRLILAEDATGTAFRFAPLQGETFSSLVPAKEREALPLSLVVRTEQGTLLTRSAAVLHIMRRLGGLWRLLAGLLVLLPVGLRDRLYDGVARIRHRLFARPAETCPLMPPHLRARFDP